MKEFDLAYQQYLDYVNDEWEFGGVDELEDNGWVVVSNRTDEEVSYRALTIEEFVEGKFYERNNHFKG
jgi:hypothetical protein